MYERLLDFLFPLTCAFCGMPSRANERQVCEACAADLPWISEARQQESPDFNAVVAPLAYEFPVDAAIKAYKFRGRSYYQPAFVEILLSALGRIPPGVDAVMPVPLHRWRLMKRGFNQARELAVPVARALGVPLLENVRRCRATPYQSGLNPAERRANLQRAFELRGSMPCSHVLIVDDIVTTGETCGQIATLLKNNGVDEVSVLAVARTVR